MLLYLPLKISNALHSEMQETGFILFIETATYIKYYGVKPTFAVF